MIIRTYIFVNAAYRAPAKYFWFQVGKRLPQAVCIVLAIKAMSHAGMPESLGMSGQDSCHKHRAHTWKFFCQAKF